MLLIVVYSQDQAATYTLPQDDVFTLETFRNGPEPDTLNYPSISGVEWQNMVLAYLICIFYALATIELVYFYFAKTRPEAKKGQEAKPQTLAEKVAYVVGVTFVRAPFHFLVYLFVIMTFSYLGIMIVWFLLGAVINPFKYLPYAAAALTLVFVTSIRASQLWQSRTKTEKLVKTEIKNRIANLLQTRSRSAKTDKILAEDPSLSESDERFLDRRSKQEFSKLVEGTGLDRSTVDIHGLAVGAKIAVNT